MAINCELDLFPQPVFSSDVVFANPLPVIFDLESTYFPINTTDPIYTITNVVNNNGYAQVSLGLTSSDFICGDFIAITGTYEGVYQITNLLSAGVFVIDAPFIQGGLSTPSGTVQLYRNNYFVQVEVYAGIPTAHNYNLDNPMELITTLRVTPNPENIANIDISGALRAKFLAIENDVCSQMEEGNYYFNDRRAWVAFYIRYREVYDRGDACATIQEVSEWTQSSTYYAINGTSQFQYAYGNNAGEYVLNNNGMELPTKFLTTIEKPIIWTGKEQDIAVFIPILLMDNDYVLQINVTSDVGTYTQTIDFTLGEGVYRILLGDILADELQGATYFDVTIKIDAVVNTETKKLSINSKCSQYSGEFVTYLNTLGGWDYILFASGQDVSHDTENTQEVERNIFASWANVFTGGTTQRDSILKQARKGGVLRTLPLPKTFFRQVSEQLASTVKVQKITPLGVGISCLDVPTRKTIIIEKNTFSYTDTEKNYVISMDYIDTNVTLSQWQ